MSPSKGQSYQMLFVSSFKLLIEII